MLLRIFDMTSGCRDIDWPKTVNSWWASRFWWTPIFCGFLAWRASKTRPGQYGRRYAHISWHFASTQGGDNIFRRRTPVRSAWREVGHYELCQAKTVRRCFTSLDLYVLCYMAHLHSPAEWREDVSECVLEPPQLTLED